MEMVTSIAIQHYSFICTEANGYNYCWHNEFSNIFPLNDLVIDWIDK